MTQDDWLDKAPMAEVLADQARQIARRYRLTEADAGARLRDAFAGNGALREAAATAQNAKALARTRVFRDAVSAARQALYYDLRTYRAGDDRGAAWADRIRDACTSEERLQAIHTIAAEHVSTRERLDSLKEFASFLREQLQDANTLLDAGCGVLPLLLFALQSDTIAGLRRYLALERDENSVAALQAFCQASPRDVLEARHWHLEQGWPAGESFDVALLLKLVPVVARQQRELLPLLADVPARRIVLSGARQSMTKRQSIERRERAILLRFAEDNGWRLLDETTTADEVLLVCEKYQAQPPV